MGEIVNLEDWQITSEEGVSPYLTVPETFTAEECKRIIACCSEYTLEDGVTWNGSGFSVNPKLRLLKTAYVPRDSKTEWIYDRMDEQFFRAAKYWGLDVRKTLEDLKFLIYSSGSHFSSWHRDTGRGYAELRKISMSVELNDSTEYEGGELHIFPVDAGHAAGAKRTAGTAVVFPSHMFHRVSPVQTGVRYSLVNWISGPKLR